MQPNDVEQLLKTYRPASPPATLDDRLRASIGEIVAAPPLATHPRSVSRRAVLAAAALAIAIAGGAFAIYRANLFVPTAPAIAFEQNVLPFGALPEDTLVSKSVAVYNRGGQELRINEVRATCGCTLAKFQNKTVPPGGQTSLVVTIDPAKVRHPYGHKKVVVHSNDPVRPQAIVEVTAESVHSTGTWF